MRRNAKFFRISTIFIQLSLIPIHFYCVSGSKVIDIIIYIRDRYFAGFKLLKVNTHTPRSTGKNAKNAKNAKMRKCEKCEFFSYQDRYFAGFELLKVKTHCQEQEKCEKCEYFSY
eukprot:Pgem_evm1s12542